MFSRLYLYFNNSEKTKHDIKCWTSYNKLAYILKEINGETGEIEVYLDISKKKYDKLFSFRHMELTLPKLVTSKRVVL